MMASTVEILIEARRLLIEKGWTQGAYARCNGVDVSHEDPNADCYCLVGAVRAADYRLDQGGRQSGATEALEALEAEGALAGLPSWRRCFFEFNDAETTTKTVILDVLSAAIARTTEGTQ